jgi:zinc D-Ala-D-Ala carboxypeptidase
MARQYRLSNNFTLWEFLYSKKAEQQGLMAFQYEIPETYILNLQKLCVHVLQPLRQRYGLIYISSGYRSTLLNEAIRGAKNSEHMKGKAADIVFAKMPDAFGWIQKNLEYRQLIDEYKFSWIHISFDEFDNKKQVLHIG